MSNNTLSEVRLSRMKSFHNLVESGVASKTKMCLLSLSGARMSIFVTSFDDQEKSEGDTILRNVPSAKIL